MEFTVTQQQLLSQANELKKLYQSTREQKYKDQENRLRRIVVELSQFEAGGSQTLQDVTDLGNITTNAIDTAGIKSDYFLLDTTATPMLQPGMMRWDDTDGTVEIALKYGDVVLQLGQETHYIVRNSTGSTIQNGTAVYASGVTAGSGRIEASPYVADGSIREVRFLGLATHNIGNGVNGVVTYFGYVRGLDTRGTAVTAISVGDENWSIGDILYVHPTVPGKLTNIKPKHEITVGILINRHQNSGVLFVRPSSSGHLDDIHDVTITTPSDGDLLKYHGSTQTWENWTPNFLTTVPTLDQVTTAGNTTTNDISIGALTLSKLQSNIMIQAINLSEPSFNYQLYNSGSATLQSAVFTQGLYYSSTRNGYISFHRGSAGTDGFLSFGDSGGERMRIAYGGNLLIGGTINSTYKLDVSGNVKLNGDSYLTGRVGIGYDPAGGGSKLTIVSSDDTQVGVVRITTNGATELQLGGNTTYSWIQSFNSKPLYINPLGNNTILNSPNGFVGIGTTSPQSKLHVEGVGVAYNLIASTGNATFRMGDSATRATRKEFYIILDNTNNRVDIQAVQQGVANRPITLNASGGNVLIGTTTDSIYKLDVSGSIQATSLSRFAGIIVERTDSNENLIQITQSSVGNAAHLYSKGDGYLGWIGIEGSTNERRFAFESNPNIDSGRHFNLVVYDANGTNQVSAFAATRTAFSIGIPLTVNGIVTATGGNSTNWNTSYGWGNHATAGYLPASAGWSGNIFIPMNLPGQQNITVNNGQITNVS
jgi:hypothetical protein